MAYYMHREPEFFHKFEVLVNHFIELVAPFFVLIPYFRRLTIFGGISQIIFQVSVSASHRSTPIPISLFIRLH